jgi:type III secretion protein V
MRVSALRRYGDVVLAALVVAVVGMMILPLPTPILDVLLAANISIAVLVLLVTLYVSDALRIAAFPTILLLTTLFRLGLNVSSTRLILGQADAGRVIAAFGDFVVAGNVAVGAVIFLILTVIQFVVIAKGAERVAEVAARFTLDALPGKQMSVDADLRAGLINAEEARSRRSAMQRESQFYGAMDGAMKFVKGDAIAGIVITLVNIVAGLGIGVLQMGMSAGEAAETYATLTVGDGLVSQIPALLLSTAAGFVVTRVASEDAGGHLGADIGAQIIGQPKAFLILAVLLFGLALVPGMPLGPFLVLALLAGLAAWRLAPRRAPAATKGGREPVEEPAVPPPTVAPIVLEAGEELAPRLEPGTPGGARFDAALAAVREEVRAITGVPIPPIRVRVGVPGLPVGGYRIVLHDVPFGRGRVPDSGRLLLGPPAALDRLAPSSAPADLPWTRRAARWSERDVPAEPGVTSLDPAEAIRAHVRAVLLRNASQFLGLQETQELLDRLEEVAPAVVRAAVPKPLSLDRAAALLRILAEEQVPIRDLRRVLEAAVGHAGERDAYLLAERVRADLRRTITAAICRGGDTVGVLVVAPEVEDVLRESIRDLGDGPRLLIEPETAEGVVASAREAIAGIAPEAGPPIVLTQPEIRRHLWRLLDLDIPDVRVISYRELDPSVRIESLGRIEAGPSAGRAAP